MATFTFNGTESQTIDFDPAEDTVIIDNVDAEDVASFTQTNSSVTLTLVNGTALTLSGVIFASLTATSLQAGSNSDLDFAIGTTGDDTGPLDGNIVVALAGDDSVTASTEFALVLGNEGLDSINGGSFESLRLFGGQGNDTIDTFGDSSTVYGGLGADTIDATGATGDAGVTIFGGNGTNDTADGGDAITGVAGADLIYGNGGDDTIVGGGGADTIYGGAGDDDITLGANATGDVVVVYGGLGEDTISATGLTEGVTIYGGNGSNDSVDGGDDLTGGDGSDLIYGNGGDDTIVGGDGDNSIYGGQGADDITGGADGDLIFGNLGDDTIVSGGGSDTIYGGQGNDDITLGAGTSADEVSVYGGLGEDTVNAASSTGSVTIYGGNGSSDASDGADDLTGSTTTENLIYGNGGDDTIVGGDVNDTIFGGAGADSINGGLGNDQITGGAGDDIFVATVNDGTAEDYAIITDFSTSSDTIEFGDAITTFSTITPGTVAAEALETYADVYTAYGSNLAAGEAIAVVINSGDLAGTTFVLADTDGTAGADEVVALTGFTGTLGLNDFSVA